MIIYVVYSMEEFNYFSAPYYVGESFLKAKKIATKITSLSSIVYIDKWKDDKKMLTLKYEHEREYKNHLKLLDEKEGGYDY